MRRSPSSSRRRPRAGRTRFDEPTAFFAYPGAARSLALLEEIGVDRTGTQVRGLAARCRAGLATIGGAVVPGDSPVVAVPGLGHRADALREAGGLLSSRAGHPRAWFHLYDTSADVNRALGVIAG
ncbi:hypothetical protein [Streptomyces sp. NPDC058855]|uniref:hypothetical protein n=1 Tax=Streptomyces sp. NPDC058855 TaxID=3346651 RepID=UPI0036A96C9E